MRTDYLDALFMCFSAMSTAGLNLVSVSALQPAQQAFLFILMILGDIVSLESHDSSQTSGMNPSLMIGQSVVNLITIGFRL